MRQAVEGRRRRKAQPPLDVAEQPAVEGGGGRKGHFSPSFAHEESYEFGLHLPPPIAGDVGALNNVAKHAHATAVLIDSN